MQKKELNKHLVSIVMPTFNAEKFVNQTIESVINQSYSYWELIIVDDYSTDDTVNIVNSYIDKRIQFIQLSRNQGAAIARNTALKKISGEYVAFIDIDDLWKKDKLEKQLAFMKENDFLFSSTDYAEINEKGEKTGTIVPSIKRLDYDGVLKHCPGNSTVMYNAKELGIFIIPDIKKRNDYVMWLQVIKKAKYLYGLGEVLTCYRVREGSLSKDKKSLVKYQWKVYREIEKLSLGKSVYLLAHKIMSVLKKK